MDFHDIIFYSLFFFIFASVFLEVNRISPFWWTKWSRKASEEADLEALDEEDEEQAVEGPREEESPKQADEFIAQYRLGNITLCIAQGDAEGVFQVFSRIGDNGTPVYEMPVAASSVDEALRAAIQRLGLKPQ